jgi:chromosome segregation ATPase
MGDNMGGGGGLIQQIEKARKEIHKIQKDYKKLREIYRLDYQKMQLLLGKMNDKIKDQNTQTAKMQGENDKLIEQKAEKEDKMNALNQEISEFQLENLKLPNETKYTEDHYTVCT